VTAGQAGSDNGADAYEAPDDALVESALSLIGDLQHRRVFYTQLKNPKWVRALAAHDAFKSAPGLVSRNGGVTAPPWAEGDYLARMADRVPTEVKSVLEPIADSDNVVVQRAVVEAASRMPAEVAATLVIHIADYMDQPYREWLDLNALASIVRALADAELERPTLRLAQALYRPREPGGSDGRSYEVAAGLDPDAYAMTLSNLVPSLAKIRPTLKVAVGWLEQWQLLSGEYRPAEGTDNSFLWRRSISPHEQNETRSNQIGHALVDAVCGIAFAQYLANRSADDIVETIEQGGQPIHARIAMDFIARAITHDIETVEIKGPQIGAELRAQAGSHLTNAAFLGYHYRHEYALLARIALPVLPEMMVKSWTGWIDRAPFETDDELRQRLRVFKREDSDVTDREVADYRDAWLRDLLAGIGDQALPSAAKRRLSALLASCGPAREHVDFPVYMSWGFSGPSSPRPLQELETLSAAEVLDYIHTWVPGEDQIFGPSVEGLAGTLRQLVTLQPDSFGERAEDLADVDPGYVESALLGFQAALADGRAFSWNGPLRLVRRITRDLNLTSLADTDDDTYRWRSTQLVAGNLVLAGIVASDSRTRIPDDLLELAWSSLVPLTNSQDPTAETERRYGGDMDPLTLSVNTVRPVALRATIRLLVRASWGDAERRRDIAVAESPLTVPIEAVLADHAGPHLDPSLATAAVFGEGLGTLLSGAPQWTTARLSTLLGPPDRRSRVAQAAQAWHDTVWSVMLAGYRPSRTLLEALRPWYVQRIADLNSEKAETVGFRGDRSPRQLLADHVLLLHVTGQLDGSDEVDLLNAMFDTAPPDLLGDALGHVGAQLMRNEGDIPTAVLDRCQTLWDWRASEVRTGRADPHELAGFSWWIRSGRFPAEWWLPHLMQALADNSFQARSTLFEPLAKVASAHPREALEAVMALTEGDGDAMTSYYIHRDVPSIIAAGLDSGSKRATKLALIFMNQLGRRGYVDLDRQVADARHRRAD